MIQPSSDNNFALRFCFRKNFKKFKIHIINGTKAEWSTTSTNEGCGQVPPLNSIVVDQANKKGKSEEPFNTSQKIGPSLITVSGKRIFNLLIATLVIADMLFLVFSELVNLEINMCVFFVNCFVLYTVYMSAVSLLI